MTQVQSLKIQIVLILIFLTYIYNSFTCYMINLILIPKEQLIFGVYKGKTVYLYSLDWKVLYYCGCSLNEIKGALGIHYATCTNCIKTGDSYLDFFRISTDYLDRAEKTKLSLQELLNLIDMKRSVKEKFQC